MSGSKLSSNMRLKANDVVALNCFDNFTGLPFGFVLAISTQYVLTDSSGHVAVRAWSVRVLCPLSADQQSEHQFAVDAAR
jgi:hypothetical protein